MYDKQVISKYALGSLMAELYTRVCLLELSVGCSLVVQYNSPRRNQAQTWVSLQCKYGSPLLEEFSGSTVQDSSICRAREVAHAPVLGRSAFLHIKN